MFSCKFAVYFQDISGGLLLQEWFVTNSFFSIKILHNYKLSAVKNLSKLNKYKKQGK